MTSFAKPNHRWHYLNIHVRHFINVANRRSDGSEITATLATIESRWEGMTNFRQIESNVRLSCQITTLGLFAKLGFAAVISPVLVTEKAKRGDFDT